MTSQNLFQFEGSSALFVQKILKDMWFALVLSAPLQLLIALTVESKHPLCALNLLGSSSQQTLLQVSWVDHSAFSWHFDFPILLCDPSTPPTSPSCLLPPHKYACYEHSTEVCMSIICTKGQLKAYTVTPLHFFFPPSIFRLLKELTESPINKYITTRDSKGKKVTISDQRQGGKSSHSTSLHFEGAVDAKSLWKFKTNKFIEEKSSGGCYRHRHQP